MAKRSFEGELRSQVKPQLRSLLSTLHCSDKSVRLILAKLDGAEDAHAAERTDTSYRRWAKNIADAPINLTCEDHTLELEGGGTEIVPVARLERVLDWYSSECVESFGRLLKTACVENAGEGLSIVIYTDEVTPGNALAPDNARKSYLFYFTVADFKQKIRSTEAWLPICIVRSSLVKKLPGGFSRLCRDLFRIWAKSPLFQHGFVLTIDGEPLLVRCKKRIRLLVDYAAAADAWSSKGASGIVPCMWCTNVVTKSSGLAQIGNADGYVVTLACSDHSKFDVRTRDAWICIASKLEHAGRDQSFGCVGRRDRAEMSAGFTWSEDSLLQAAADDLKDFCSPEDTCVDGMHSLFASGGICQVEIGRLVNSLLNETTLTLQDMQQALKADWKKPFRLRGASPSAHEWTPFYLLNEKRLAETHYRGSASEVLYLLPLLEWLVTSLTESFPQMEPQFNSFVACCELARQYQILKNNFSSEPDCVPVLEAAEKHLASFVAAYGEDACKPKHHLTFHLPHQVEEGKLLFDGWTPERKNGHFTALVNNNRLKQLKGLERSALGRLMQAQRENLASKNVEFQDHLGVPNYPCPQIAEFQAGSHVQIAKWMQMGMQKFAVDDVLLLSSTAAAQVVACMWANGRPGMLVRKLEVVSRTGNSACWRTAPGSFDILQRADDCLKFASLLTL